MADNLKRDGDKARWTYPIMMKGEWPVLLDILGKGEGEARYLSVADVRTLFVDRNCPSASPTGCRLPSPASRVTPCASRPHPEERRLRRVSKDEATEPPLLEQRRARTKASNSHKKLITSSSVARLAPRMPCGKHFPFFVDG